MNESLKQKLIKQAKSDDLKLAIAAQNEKVQDKSKQWVPNEFFKILESSFGRTELAVMELVENGLSFAAGDFYVYAGRGGIKVHETPKGVRKQLQRIAASYGLNIVVSDGVLYKDDKVSLKTDGRIDEVEIIKSQNTMMEGGEIIAPYAVVTVFRAGGEIVAKKLFIIPKNEYSAIVKAGSGSSYPTMMAQKSVMKRVAAGIHSLLGVSLGNGEAFDDIEGRLEDIDEPRSSTKEPQKQKDAFVDSEAVETKKTTEVSLDDIQDD